MEINTVSTLVGLSRHPLSCLISRSPRSSSTLFFVFSFPFLLPPSSFSLSFLVGSLSLWWRRYYWPPVPRECRITLASSIVLLGRLLNFSRDWIGEGFFISSLGCFPVVEKRVVLPRRNRSFCSFEIIQGQWYHVCWLILYLIEWKNIEEYWEILKKKISNTFCEVNFKAMKRKKKVAIRKNESLGDESTSYAKVKKGEELWQSVEMRQKGWSDSKVSVVKTR